MRHAFRWQSDSSACLLPPWGAWFYIGIIKKHRDCLFTFLCSPQWAATCEIFNSLKSPQQSHKAKQKDQPSSVILGSPPSCLWGHWCLSASWKRNKIPKACYAFNWLVLPNLWHSLYFYLIPEGHYENKQLFWSPAILVTSPMWLTNQPSASTAPADPPVDYLQQKSGESFQWVCKWLGLTEGEEGIIRNCL